MQNPILSEAYYRYGAPAIGGLATSLKAAREEENIGPIALAGAAGATGAYAGLKAAQQYGPGLAGKLAPFVSEIGAKVGPVFTKYGGNRRGTTTISRGAKKGEKVTKKAFLGDQAERLGNVMQDQAQVKDLITDPTVANILGSSTAVATIPIAGLTAGLGGAAAGKAIGAFGIPGFVDPEAYGSSNSPGARYKQSTVNYV
tara:strand:+ start:49 stop:648 length:600 start_codon:yes stop_codon:yes gene_type:complete